MSAVPQAEAHCARMVDDGAYCYEWRLSADPTLRIVSTGYEDGGQVDLYRRIRSGQYRHLTAILPALRDRKHPGKLFWGYSWDIEDVVLAPETKTLRFLATFEHHEVDDAEAVAVGKERADTPLVLFVGTTRQPEMTIKQVPFRALSVQDLQRGK